MMDVERAAYGARKIKSHLSKPCKRSATAGARRRANASLAKAKKMIAGLWRMPKIEADGDESLADRQKSYRDSLKKLKAAAARLQSLIGSMPDATAQRAAAHLVTELETEVGE